MTVLSTSATSGTEIFDKIIGAASAHTRRWVGRSRQSANREDDMQAPLGSAIVTCESVLARAAGSTVCQTSRSDAIVSKPAPTIRPVCLWFLTGCYIVAPYLPRKREHHA